MDIGMLSPAYAVRALGKDDAQSVLRFYEGNPKYFAAMSSAPSLKSVCEDMDALPPGKTEKDKHYLGFFGGETLVAVMDLIEGFPNPETAFIGLFMVNRDYQGRGVGSAIICDALHALCKMGFSYVRLGYVETNAQSKAFWYKNGFLPTGVKSAQEKYAVVMMQKELYGGMPI